MPRKCSTKTSDQNLQSGHYRLVTGLQPKINFLQIWISSRAPVCGCARMCARVCVWRACGVRVCAHRYPRAYTHAPMGVRMGTCARVGTRPWVYVGTREGAGGRVGARVLVWYPHVYKKSLKLEKRMPNVNASKLLFYLSFLGQGLLLTNI